MDHCVVVTCRLTDCTFHVSRLNSAQRLSRQAAAADLYITGRVLASAILAFTLQSLEADRREGITVELGKRRFHGQFAHSLNMQREPCSNTAQLLI